MGNWEKEEVEQIFENHVEVTASVEENKEKQPQYEPKREYVKPERVSPFADSPYVMQVPVKQPVRKKKKARGGMGKRILAVVLVVALVAAASGITASCLNRRWEAQLQSQLQTQKNSLDAQRAEMEDKMAAMEAQMTALEEKLAAIPKQENTVITVPSEGEDGMTPAQIYAENVDSVVAVTSLVTTQDLFGQSTQGGSLGTGFIISEDGYVVTNHHVISGGEEITLTLSDNRKLTATLVGFDEDNDLAVLKADATGLPCVTLGSSNELIVGERVVAIGNALGKLNSTLTVGYVSAKDRVITTEGQTINMLQTDAAINSGNSGGPLFNMRGEVVGITSAKYSGMSSSGASIEGIGFAIPLDDVMGMIEDLMEFGYIKGAYLGVMVKNVTEAVSQNYGLPMGAYVDEVHPDSAAEKAGVQVKDIIVAVGDQKVNSVNALTRTLRRFEAGETSTVTVFRNGAEMQLTITFDETPQP